MKTYVLDACALIAYLRDESGGEVLESMLAEENKRFLLHGVTLGEVYYDSLRTVGKASANCSTTWRNCRFKSLGD